MERMRFVLRIVLAAAMLLPAFGPVLAASAQDPTPQGETVLLKAATEAEKALLDRLSIRYQTAGSGAITAAATADQLRVLRQQGVSFARLPGSGLAGRAVAAPLIEISNEYLILSIVDTGQFTVLTADGRYLLYPAEGTGYLSVRVGSAVYTNADGSLEVTTPLTVVSGDQAYIRYQTPEGIRITQWYTLRGEAVQLDVEAANPSGPARQVAIRHLLDTQVDENDGSPLYAPPVGVRVNETDMPSPAFDTWRGYDQWPDPTLTAVGTLSTPPSRMVFAWWPTAVDYPWDYAPDPDQPFYTPGYTSSPESDSCVLLYFDLGSLSAGGTARITTYYGTDEPTGGAGYDRLVSALDDLRSAIRSSIEADLDAFAGLQAKYFKALQTDWRDYVETAWTLASLTVLPHPTDLAKLGKDAELLSKFAKVVNAVEAGTDVGTGLVALVDQIPASASEQQIKDEYIVPYLMDQQQIGSYAGVAGVLAAIDQDFNDYVQQIPDPLPPDYPTEEIIAFIQLQISALNASRSGESWVMTYDDMWCPLAKLGVLHEQEASMAELVEDFEAAEDVSFLFTLFEIGTFAGAGGLKIAGVVSAPATAGAGTVATEALFWGKVATIAAIPGIFGGISTAAGLSAKGTMTALSFEAMGQLPNDLETRRAVLQGTGNWIVSSVLMAAQQRAPLLAAPSIEVSGVETPDVILAADEAAGAKTGQLRVRNTGSTTAYISIYGNITTELDGKMPILGLVDSDPVSVGAGQERTIPFSYTLLRSTLLDRTGFDAHLLVTAANQGGVEIEGPLQSHFYAGTEEQLSVLGEQLFDTMDRGTLDPGQDTDLSVDFPPDTESGRLHLSFPEGSDQDLHLFDSQGRHVGVDYDSGQVELEIPGVDYSGPKSRSEWMSLQAPGTELFGVKIVSQHTGSGNQYDLSKLASGQLRALLDSVARVEWQAMRDQPGVPTTESFSLLISEGGGSQDVTQLSLTPSNLTSEKGDVLPASSLDCRAPSQILAGGFVLGDCQISVPPELPAGVYSGKVDVLGRDPGGRSLGTETEIKMTVLEPKPEFYWAYLPLVVRGYRAGPVARWTTILAENFEGAFPGPWWLVDANTGGGEYTWGRRNCRPLTGAYSGWAVGGGADGAALGCGSPYPHQARSWMVYGPFSLADATDAQMTFRFWLNVQGDEWTDYLFWGASTNGEDFSGRGARGTAAAWYETVFDLTDVYQMGDLTGQPRVWIALVFVSDASVNYPEGAYVDDLLLEKYVSATGRAPQRARSEPGLQTLDMTLSLDR